jgi:hypothetical protein
LVGLRDCEERLGQACRHAGPAQDIQAELIRQAGRTGEPGIDPAAEHLHGDLIRIRQSFPNVSAWQAATLAGEGLRRTIRNDEVVRIETVQHSDWLRLGGRD